MFDISFYVAEGVCQEFGATDCFGFTFGFLAPFPGAEMPTPAPVPGPGPVDMFPHIDIPAPNPRDLETAGATGTGIVAGGGLLALLSMLFVQNRPSK